MQLLLILAFFVFVDLCDSDKRLCLLDLYTCVDEFEDYCNQIPRFTVAAAAELANSRDDVLPGYTLCTLNKLYDSLSLISDGKVLITSTTLDNFYKELDIVLSQPNSTVSPIVLGSPFSFVTEYAVDILGKHQNFAQVHFNSIFVNLGDSPFFNRIGPDKAFFNAVQLQLLVRNNWRRVGILSSLDTFSLTADALEQKLKKEKISIIKTESFIIEEKQVWNDQLTCLKDKDIRIIIALITVIEVPLIMCTAYDIGLIDEHHVWILPEMNLNDVRKVAKQYNTCDVDVVLNNALMVGENYYNLENHSLPFEANDLDDLLIKYNNLSSATDLTEIPGYNLSRVVFDATWTVILALNNSMQPLAEKGQFLEESVNHNGVDQKISDIIKESLNQVKFSGLSGMVDFSHRMRNSSGTSYKAHISRVIGNSICTVEMYNETGPISVSNVDFCSYTWGNDPPVSEAIIHTSQVPFAVLTSVIIVTVIFMLVGMALITFSVALRKHRYMKTSSVTINIMIIVGCMMSLMVPVLILLMYGAGHYAINETQFNTLCYAYFFLENIGLIMFSIALLFKTWRLYYIKNNKLLKLKIRYISKKAMLMITVILLLPAVLLMSLQLILDRPKMGTEVVKIKERYPCEYMKYTFYDQTHWELWSTVYTLYNITILVVTFLQAGNVSQMNIKKLAFEGDISIRLLSMLVIISSCYIFISTILMTAKNYYAATIVYAFGIMISHVIVISMIFLPKVYVIIKDYRSQKSESTTLNLK